MRWRVLAADAADMNPVDPDGPSFGDNAQNSIEQEVATETWVDHALDLMSRGAMQQEVVAKLAHDGCPDPEAVYARAVEQQAQQSNEFNSGPDEATPMAPGDQEYQTQSDMPMGSGVMASVYTHPEQPEPNMGVQGVDDLKRQIMEAETAGDQLKAQELRERLKTMWHGYTGSVKVANFVGTFRGMELDNWGRLIVAVDTENGPMQLDGEQAEPVADKSADEVSEIQQFIDSIPEVEPNDLTSVASRIEKLQEARTMVIAALGRASEADLGPLVQMRVATTNAIKDLTTRADGIVTASERAYLDTQTKYKPGAVVAANGSVGGFDSPDLDQVVASMAEETADYNVAKEHREGAAIMVAELPELMVRDAAAVRELAEDMVLQRTAAMDDETQMVLVAQFCAAVEEHRAEREAELTRTSSQRTASLENTEPDNDGPAEALFR